MRVCRPLRWGRHTLCVFMFYNIFNKVSQMGGGYLSENYKATHGEYPATRRAGQNFLGTNWGAGDIMYADLKGDGVINYGQYTLSDHGDYSIIGNSTPRYSLGLNLDAQWKGFDVKYSSRVSASATTGQAALLSGVLQAWACGRLSALRNTSTTSVPKTPQAPSVPTSTLTIPAQTGAQAKTSRLRPVTCRTLRTAASRM